jgi:hypothetical protein
MPNSQTPTIQVICDLRQYNKRVDTVATMQALWQQASKQLVGKTLVPGAHLDIQISDGKLLLWVVDAANVARVEANTAFNIVDMLRSPRLLHACQKCGKHGPLRCAQCVNEHRPEGQTWLCADCAYFIKNEPAAYCPKHIPRCSCRSGCKDPAFFSCHTCKKLYGKHKLKAHPHNAAIDYCETCYQNLFSLCSVCSKQHKSTLGKSRCAFRMRTVEKACGLQLCWEHSFQWKIWGPNNRGLVLCAQHKQRLGNSDLTDLLFMMLVTPPPERTQYRSLFNAYRIRRIINRNRTTPVSFTQLQHTLATISNDIKKCDLETRRRYDEMVKSFHETISALPRKEQELVQQVKAFYQQKLGKEAATQIARLEIKDCFFKPGEPPRYKVEISLNGASKWRYIGSNGALVNVLQSQLNIDADF